VSGGFDLDLQAVEEHMDEDDEESRVVLGVLDGTTPPEEWIAVVESGNVLVLTIEGNLNDLASGFAREIKDMGGHLVQFRNFLVLSPPDLPIDSDRL